MRENGGQYTHAAAWVIAAFARLGGSWYRARAVANGQSCPADRMTADDCRRYLLEPYLIAGDVYGAGPHAGRGGWSGYTGSSGWVYRVVLEEILGIKPRVECDPRRATAAERVEGLHDCLRRPRGTLTIDIENRPGAGADRAAQVELDGIVVADGLLPLDVTGDHHARVRLEPASVEAQSVSVPSTVEPS